MQRTPGRENSTLSDKPCLYFYANALSIISFSFNIKRVLSNLARGCQTQWHSMKARSLDVCYSPIAIRCFGTVTMLLLVSAYTSSSVACRADTKGGSTTGPAACLGSGADADVQVGFVLEHGCLMVALGVAGHAAEAQRLLYGPRCVLHQVLAQHVVCRPHIFPAQCCAFICPHLLIHRPKSTIQLTSASAQRTGRYDFYQDTQLKFHCNVPRAQQVHPQQMRQ